MTFVRDGICIHPKHLNFTAHDWDRIDDPGVSASVAEADDFRKEDRGGSAAGFAPLAGSAGSP